MASPTQTVVGKGIPNPLIAENLLKILKELVPSSPPKSFTNSYPQNGSATKLPVSIPPTKWIETCHVNSKPQTSRFLSNSSGVSQVNIKPLTTKPTQNLHCYVNITSLTVNLSCPQKINGCHVKYYTSDNSLCFPLKSPTNSLSRNGRSTSSITAMLTLYL